MRLGRIAAITASIALIGAVLGGVIGGVLIGIWAYIASRSGDLAIGVASIGAAGVISAAIGAVLAPITAWVFLRRVPLGRALAETTIGTSLGAAGGLAIGMFAVAPPRVLPTSSIFLGTLIGFLAAVIRLRLKTRRPVTPTSSDGSPN